jgi:hypothetical protein
MSGLVSTNDIYWLQATQESSFDKTCTCTRTTKARTTTGGWSDSTTATASYACRRAAGAPAVYEQMAQAAGQLFWTVTLPHDADVKDYDTLTIDSDVLEVIGYIDDHSYQTAVRVACREKLA